MGPRRRLARLSSLINRALASEDEEAASPFVCEAYKRQPVEVVDAAETLLRSAVTRRRRLGAWLLAEIGYPSKPLLRKRLALLKQACRDDAADEVRARAILSLACLKTAAANAIVRSLHRSSSVVVRRSVAQSIPGNGDRADLRVLKVLATDPDPLVREWAAFGLGFQPSRCARVLLPTLAGRPRLPPEVLPLPGGEGTAVVASPPSVLFVQVGNLGFGPGGLA